MCGDCTHRLPYRFTNYPHFLVGVFQITIDTQLAELNLSSMRILWIFCPLVLH